jgi:hypothetical protein
VAAVAGLLAFAGAARAEPMWAAIQDGGNLVFEYFPTGPSATSTGAYVLTLGQTAVDPAAVRGFQFQQDGSMWAAIQDGGNLVFEYFPTGPAATSTGAYVLTLGQTAVDPAAVRGFQFQQDGSMWAAIQDGGNLVFEYFPTGPSATSTGAHVLTLGQTAVDPASFRGFQFQQDGSMWAAIQDGGNLVFEYFPTGPSATSTGAHVLTLGQTAVDPADFRGFQFQQDGSMWAAIQDGGNLVFEYFPTGPSATSTGAHVLTLGQTAVDPASFRGFQFVSAAIDPGGPGGAVPEPATWALLIAGFGLAGASLRRQRRALRRPAFPSE